MKFKSVSMNKVLSAPPTPLIYTLSALPYAAAEPSRFETDCLVYEACL